MEQTKRIVFFKRLKMALFELENYIQFTAERTGKAIQFAVKMSIILALIVVVSSLIYVYAKYQSFSNYVDSVIPDFLYNNHELKIDEEDKKTENKKSMAQVMQELEPTYRSILPDGNNTKDDLVNFVKSDERNIVIISSISIFIGTVFTIFIFWLTIALMTSLIGYIVLNFSRIKMKFSRLYALSIYASTLSMILNVLYINLNAYFNIYIDVFDYLSVLISYIYITAVIYMIRSDLIKQQLELIKIATVQAQVREQIEREDREEQERKDKKEREKENKEKENKNDEKQNNEHEGINHDSEPDGSEI